MRRSTERIIEECVANDSAGADGTYYLDALNPTAEYFVIIKTYLASFEMEQMHWQRASLQDETQPRHIGTRYSGFENTFYNV